MYGALAGCSDTVALLSHHSYGLVPGRRIERISYRVDCHGNQRKNGNGGDYPVHRSFLPVRRVMVQFQQGTDVWPPSLQQEPTMKPTDIGREAENNYHLAPMSAASIITCWFLVLKPFIRK